jgi:hypothetical protein
LTIPSVYGDLGALSSPEAADAGLTITVINSITRRSWRPASANKARLSLAQGRGKAQPGSPSPLFWTLLAGVAPVRARLQNAG